MNKGIDNTTPIHLGLVLQDELNELEISQAMLATAQFSVTLVHINLRLLAVNRVLDSL